MTQDDWLASIEDLIHESQVRFIERRFGAEAAGTANYGWGIDARTTAERSISVATKVYGHGVLESVAVFPSLTVFHDFRAFDDEIEK
jgi:hypothetical protein